MDPIDILILSAFGYAIYSALNSDLGDIMATKPDPTIQAFITTAAEKYDVRPEFALAVARTESGFNQAARSRVGAIGIFQLMPATARDLGVDPNDAAQNIEGGVKYLAQMLAQFGGDEAKALAAYNWGPGNVSRAISTYGGGWRDHLPVETASYIPKVLSRTADYTVTA